MKYLAAGRKILQYQIFTIKIVHGFRLAATQIPFYHILQQLWRFLCLGPLLPQPKKNGAQHKSTVEVTKSTDPIIMASSLPHRSG